MLTNATASVKRINFSAFPDKNIVKAMTRFVPENADIAGFCEIICEKAWSPIIFAGNYRAKRNFLQSELLALDFDSGELTLDQAKDLVQSWGVWAVIGTTKSHQKEKIGSSGEIQAPCDRFRLVMLCDRLIHDIEQYEWNLLRWTQKMPCDKGVKDGARYFYPCKEIFYAQLGEPIDWMELPEKYVRIADRNKQHERNILQHKAAGTIPSWVARIVIQGAAIGERHNKCYAVGAALTELGYGANEIIELLMSGPNSSIGEGDVRRAVENARSKVIGESSRGDAHQPERRNIKNAVQNLHIKL